MFLSPCLARAQRSCFLASFPVLYMQSYEDLSFLGDFEKCADNVQQKNGLKQCDCRYVCEENGIRND